ncbi:fumarylacetoacetate hydrolase [Talaromyces pinophilus]|uniref:Fumarylacetoacetate hydrolase n=1 Tax=Talaromyces pinophilus TaxID=128442 RepID=A0A510NVK9_TALPI|nr:fumarylacetoacetate hydrolase [Talaromyces pinophilus]
MKVAWERLIRFIATDGRTLYGEPILSSPEVDLSTTTAETKLQAKVNVGSNIYNETGATRVTAEVVTAHKLLGLLTNEDVPILRCVGLNYKTHIQKTGRLPPPTPSIFFKPNTTIIGHDCNVIIPKSAQDEQADYEGELCIVIGKDAKDVPNEEALDYVAAFTAGNDISSPTQLSLLNSLPRITFAAGILLGGVLGERFGRRPIIFLMLTICLIGVTISYCAQNYAQVLVGRMLVQGYIGMEGYLVPMFQAEIAPAAVRGVVVISYLFNHVFGSFIMSCITYRTSQLQNDYCWKIPIAVMFVIPAFVILCGWILPESPRWLLRRGRDEEALKQLRYLYGSNSLYTPEVELALMKETLSMEVEKVIGWTFQNLAAFVVTFTVPYLIDASYANLQSKLGFIYGAIGVLGLIWAYFSFPELMGRSLEEIDEMFVAKLPARKFRNYKPFIESAGHKVAAMEEHSANAGDSGTADLEGGVGRSSTVHVENTKNYS